MDVNLTGVIITGIICIGVLGVVVTPIVIDFKLKKARLQSDERVRIEEVNARNRLDIERLMLEHETGRSKGRAGGDAFMEDAAKVREKKTE